MARPRSTAPARRAARCLVGGLLGLALLSALPVIAGRWVDPPTSAFMFLSARRGALVQHTWVDWEQISPQLPIAVVAAEDQRFPEHAGFDLDAIGEALRERSEQGRLRGASTISQQLAKNLFLWPRRSWLRKGLEVWFTLLLEAAWPKRRILEVYLNVAQFGDGVYGVGAASQAYFGKPARRVALPEAALLAAVLPAPSRSRAGAPSAYLRERARWIEEQVRLLGGPAYLNRL